jgi:hypothetical protein
MATAATSLCCRARPAVFLLPRAGLPAAARRSSSCCRAPGVLLLPRAERSSVCWPPNDRFPQEDEAVVCAQREAVVFLSAGSRSPAISLLVPVPFYDSSTKQRMEPFCSSSLCNQTKNRAALFQFTKHRTERLRS